MFCLQLQCPHLSAGAPPPLTPTPPYKHRSNPTSQQRLLESRLRLLRFDEAGSAAQSNKVLDELAKELGIACHDSPSHAHRRAGSSSAAALPTALEASKIETQTVVGEQLRRSPDALNGFSDAALPLLATTFKAQLSDNQRRHLLNRLSVPDLPNLVELLVQDLKTRSSLSFSSAPSIANKLTLSQLDALAKALPGLSSDHAFVSAYLARLGPSADHSGAARGLDPAEQHRVLTSVKDYALRPELGPQFNSLKAAALYQLLDFETTTLGKYDDATFMTYLGIPKAFGEFWRRRGGGIERETDRQTEISPPFVIS